MAVVLTEKPGPLFDNVLPGVRKRGGKLKMEEKKKTHSGEQFMLLFWFYLVGFKFPYQLFAVCPYFSLLFLTSRL